MVAGFPVRRPEMVANTSNIGLGRFLLASVPTLELSPWVEYYVIPGSGQTFITGMASKFVEEQAQIATLWARLITTKIKTTLMVDFFKVALPLDSGLDLHIHLSPGSASSWKGLMLGGAIGVAVASLITGKHPRAEVAVVGELCGSPGGLGNLSFMDDSSMWLNVKTVQGISHLVVGSDTACESAHAHGVSLERAASLGDALSFVFDGNNRYICAGNNMSDRSGFDNINRSPMEPDVR